MASLHASLYLWIPAHLHHRTLHVCIMHPWAPEPLNPCIPAFLNPCTPAPLSPCIPALLHTCNSAPLHACILEPLHPCILASLHPVPLHPCIPTSPLASHWLWLRAGIQVIGTPAKQEHAGLCNDSICRVLVKQTQRLKFDLLCSQNWCKGQAWWHVCDPRARGVEKGGFWDPLDSSSSLLCKLKADGRAGFIKENGCHHEYMYTFTPTHVCTWPHILTHTQKCTCILIFRQGHISGIDWKCPTP